MFMLMGLVSSLSTACDDDFDDLMFGLMKIVEVVLMLVQLQTMMMMIVDVVAVDHQVGLSPTDITGIGCTIGALPFKGEVSCHNETGLLYSLSLLLILLLVQLIVLAVIW
jgi:hypothetical protein